MAPARASNSVFISYETGHKAEAEKLQSALADSKISAHIVEVEVDPGDDWKARTIDLIKGSSALILVVGDSGITAWMGFELAVAKQFNKTTIPLLLANPSDADRSLISNLMWLELRDDINDEQKKRLVQAIRLQRPIHEPPWVLLTLVLLVGSVAMLSMLVATPRIVPWIGAALSCLLLAVGFWDIVLQERRRCGDLPRRWRSMAGAAVLPCGVAVAAVYFASNGLSENFRIRTLSSNLGAILIISSVCFVLLRFMPWGSIGAPTYQRVLTFSVSRALSVAVALISLAICFAIGLDGADPTQSARRLHSVKEYLPGGMLPTPRETRSRRAFDESRVTVMTRQGFLLYHLDRYHVPWLTATRWTAEMFRELSLREEARQIDSRIEFEQDPGLPQDAQGQPLHERPNGYEYTQLVGNREAHVLPGDALAESRYMSNVVVMKDGARAAWRKLEQAYRTVVDPNASGRLVSTLWVVSGVVFDPSKEPDWHKSAYAIPDGFFKVVAWQRDGIRFRAFYIPRDATSADLTSYLVSVEEVQERAGVTLFPSLTRDARKRLREVPTSLWSD